MVDLLHITNTLDEHNNSIINMKGRENYNLKFMTIRKVGKQ